MEPMSDPTPAPSLPEQTAGGSRVPETVPNQAVMGNVDTPLRPAPPPATPTAGADRIVSLDVLRGVAVLGILVMNIQSFAMIDAAYFHPLSFGDLTGWNYATWLASHLLADTKFFTIFSMMFGAGVVLMSDRQRATNRPTVGLHYRRMLVLLFLGMSHGYLFWHGDVLYAYAMCGMVAFLLRGLRPRLLLLLGLLLFTIHSVNYLLIGLSTPMWPETELQAFVHQFRPTADMIAEEVAIYRGDWMTIFWHRTTATFQMETFVFMGFIGWEAGGLMLIGMGLYKLGVLSGRLRSSTYVALLIGGTIAGLCMSFVGLRYINETAWEPIYSFTAGRAYNRWGALPLSLAWISLVMLACKHGWLTWLTTRLASVGRMALTNYLAQSILCTTLFYGYGFGLFGEVSRLGQLGVVIAIWILQLLWSPLWLRHFRFGPIEWLWRSCTYLRLQPLRRPR
jgi:uncharacterized protein